MMRTALLCDFGPKIGWAYIETNPDDAGPQATLFRLMAGEFTGPVQVVEIDLPNGTARDVSVEFAERILQDRRLEDLPANVAEFVSLRARVGV